MCPRLINVQAELYRDNVKGNGVDYLGFRGLGFPKIRGTILRVPIIRTIVYWGLYWGPPILGNYQMCPRLNPRAPCLEIVPTLGPQSLEI